MAKMEMPWSTKLDPWQDITNRLERMGHQRTTAAMVEDARRLFENVERLVDECVAMGSFAADWPKIRTFVPLQIRLVAEQIFWTRGGEFRKYVTGFKPVDLGAGAGSSLPATRAQLAESITASETAKGTPQWQIRKKIAIAQKQVGR